MNVRDLNPAVKVPVALLDQLKQEIYTLGTSFRQASSESGLSTDTIKSILAGNNVEQSTAARLEAYLKALARNEFAAVRNLKRFDAGAMAGPGRRMERAYYALNKELWKEYKLTSLHPDAFAKLDRRHQQVELLKKERMAKLALMSKHKPFIDQRRLWIPDAWSYWRWRSFLAQKMAGAAVA